MKRYTLYMLFMAVAAVNACQKQSFVEEQSIPQESSKGSYIYTVNASIENPEVKSDYDADGKFTWSTGDAISVLFHNGSTNQFFTLTRVSGTGNSATFSGSIDDGFTIGASNTGKIWAFYPASPNHAYTVDANDNRPYFYTPPVNDLSGGNFSANIPMYDVLDAEGDFSFKNMTCAYKFTINDIDVSKIQVDIENGVSYGLSGLTTMSSNYLRYSDPTAEQKKITYICDVTSKTAVFYVSCRWSSTSFKPTVTIKDYNTGYTIKRVTASKGSALGCGEVKRLTISAPGTGSPIVSKFGIDWGNVAVSGTGATSTGHDGITTVKLTADESYFYVYLGVDDSKLLKGYDYSNYIKLYLGEASESASTSWMWGTAPNTFSEELGIGWLLRSDAAKFSSSGEAIYNDSQAVSLNGINYYELKLNRSAKTYLMNAGTVHVGFLIYYSYYAWGGTQGDDYMYAPASDSLLAASLPTYVAP